MQFLIRFEAEYYCQGFEYGWFTKLVTASSFEKACERLKTFHTSEWKLGTPRNFKDETL